MFFSDAPSTLRMPAPCGQTKSAYFIFEVETDFMATNKKGKATKTQGRSGGGGQQSGGTKKRGQSGKASGGNQKANQGGKIGGQGGGKKK